MDTNVDKYRYTNEKKVMVHVCLNGRSCSSGRVGIVSYPILSKDEVSASSSFSKTCCQCNFSEIFKGRQIMLEPCRNSNYSIRCLLSYDVHFDRGVGGKAKMGYYRKWWGAGGVASVLDVQSLFFY